MSGLSWAMQTMIEYRIILFGSQASSGFVFLFCFGRFDFCRFSFVRHANMPPQSEFVNFLRACSKKTPFSLVSCHFQCQILLFPCFSVPPPFIFICLLPSNASFNTSNDCFGHCAWQTKNVPAIKSCGLCRLWRSVSW